jgi:hypothetical protein
VRHGHQDIAEGAMGEDLASGGYTTRLPPGRTSKHLHLQGGASL